MAYPSICQSRAEGFGRQMGGDNGPAAGHGSRPPEGRTGCFLAHSLRLRSHAAGGCARSKHTGVRRTTPVGFAHCEPGWDDMGASVTLRWRVLDVDCELRIAGTAGQVSVRRDGQIIGNATVESAAALTNGRASRPTTCERNPNETGAQELIEPGSVRGGPPQRRGHGAPFDFGRPLRDILAIES